MPETPHKRKIYDNEQHAHFVTFSCYKRRTLLRHNVASKIVIGIMDAQLQNQNGRCPGFVIMPEHVQTIVRFNAPNQLSTFMKQWKQRSSVKIKALLNDNLENYTSQINIQDPIWQRKYYSFNLYSPAKIMEKINYIHNNPVRAGFVTYPEEWKYSSASYYIQGRSVGIPIEHPG